MPLVPFGDYRPDVSDYNGQHTRALANVLPQGDGYGPIPSLASYTDALADICRGAFVAYALDGSVEVFAATSTKLYKLDKTDLSWGDVSKTAGSHSYSIPKDDQWSFTQFGNIVIAGHINDVLQQYTIGTSSFFADIAGSPQCQKVAVINQFVICSGISGALNQVIWSARADTTGWTAGTDDSGIETFGDGGIVKNVEGGEFSGVVFQDQGIRRMTYSPGAPTPFSFDRITKTGGLRAAGMMAGDDERVFFLSTRGFQMLPAGSSTSVPIGKEKVDRYFFSDWDSSEPRTAIAVIDPSSHRVFFAYFSISGQTEKFDKILVYDWVLERWAPVIGILGEYIFPFSQPGTTLEGLDAQVPTYETDVTVTNASPGVVSWSMHGLSNNDPIYLTLEGTCSGLASNTTYYVANKATDTFQVSASAGPGASIDTTGSQSGAITAHRAVTISIAAPGVVTLRAHGRSTNDTITFLGGTLPTGLVEGTVYFANKIDADTFSVSATLGAGAITTTGTHTGPTTIYYTLGGIEALALSLDAFPLSQAPELGVVDPENAICFFRGDALEAELHTAEISGEYNRAFVDGFRPITDAPTVHGRVSYRETLSDTILYTAEALRDAQGFCAIKKDARISKYRIRIPAGTSWTFAMGVAPALQKSGNR